MQEDITDSAKEKAQVRQYNELIERAVEVNQKIGTYFFIDYWKTFDQVERIEIIHMLTDRIIDGTDLRIIKQLCWKQKATVRTDNQVGEYHNMKVVVQQSMRFLT